MTGTLSELYVGLRLDLLGYLVLSVVLGGAIGLERELHGKPAGLRTNILICVGSTLFTQLSVLLTAASGDPSRVAAQIVTGVGFIGAGTIIQGRGNIVGLTSAATIWMVAAIGMAVGSGALLEATGATLLVFLVLSLLGRLEGYVAQRAEVVRLMIEVDQDPDRVRAVERVLLHEGLEVEQVTAERLGEHVLICADVVGPRPRQDAAKLALLRVPGAFKVSVQQ